MENTIADAADESTSLLKAFADPVRLRLLNLLSGDREVVSVCVLHGALELPQPNVSRHLANPRKHGLVAGRKEGLWIHYRLARPKAGLHRIHRGASAIASATPKTSARTAWGPNGPSPAAATEPFPPMTSVPSNIVRTRPDAPPPDRLPRPGPPRGPSTLPGRG